MKAELTDVLLQQVLFLHKKKFNPRQISIVTDLPPSQVKRITSSKLVKKKEAPSTTFKWEDFDNSVI